MEFVHPERLWFLFLSLIPVIIHLFHFRKRKNFYFSSLRFLQYLEKEQQNVRKLKHFILLLCRILAILAIVIAFAQPQLIKNVGQKSGKNAVIIYLDNSFSLSAFGAEGTLFSEGRELAKRIISKLEPDTRVLICSNLLDNQEQRFISKAAAKNYLDKLELYALPRTLNEILLWQQQCIKQHEIQHEKLGNIKQFLISDFQQNQCLIENQEPKSNQTFFAYQLKAQNAQNAYIDSVWFSKPTHQLQTEQQLNVRVINAGELNQKHMELKIEIGKIKRTLFAELNTKGQTTISFPYTETNSGLVTGSAQINDAQIHFDDTWYFSYEVPEQTSIYLIEDENSSPAVQKAFSVEPRYKIQKTSISQVNSSALQESDLIVLNGLNSIASGITQTLLEAHQNGQRILIIPGEQILFNEYRALLEGLSLPVLGSIQNSQLALQKINDNDPFFAGVFEKKQERLNVPLLKKSYSVFGQAQSGATSLLILRSGQPLFLRSSDHAFLFTSALDPSFGSIVNQSLFPTILLRCAEYASKRFAEYAVLGKDVQIKVRANYQQEAPLLLKSPQTEFIVQYQSSPNLLRIQIGGSAALEKLKANHYELLSSNILAKLALNYNRSESELSYLEPTLLKQRFGEKGIKNCTFNQVSNGQSLQDIELESNTTFWRFFLVLALSFLFIELALLKWWK